MVVILAWDKDDNFVCTMNFPNMMAFESFNANISFDEPLEFEVLDFEIQGDTLQ